MRQTISFLLICVIYIGMFSPAIVQTNAQVKGKTITQNMNPNLPNGLQFRLSEGEEGAENREKQQPVKGDALTDGDTSKLLKRLPEIKADADDKTEFAKRIGTLPAPKTGDKIPVKFPSDEERNPTNVQQNNQTLEVLRFSPEGEVPLAPDLSVTFSQPMVAVTSQEEAAKTVPVEMSPSVEGNWRWLGTKTLMFDTKKRFPMATKFTVRIPAGTKAATGQVLQKDVVWTFTTPPPKVEQMIPANQVTRRDALMFASFDQEINPNAILATMKISGGGKPLKIRLATQEEIDKDASVSYYAKQAQPKRWLAFRAITNEDLTQNALPADAAITVNFPKGTPSAEGPITTIKDQSFAFRTFGAMKFVGGWCSYQGNKNCSPFEPWYLQFSNPIEAAKFTKEMIKIEPAIEGLNIYPSGNYVYIQGYKKGRTTYKVTVDSAIQDVYEQKLGTPGTATITVGSAESSLYSQGGTFAVIDPTAAASYSIYSTNMPSVKVRIYEVKPENWTQFQNYVRYINYDDETKKPQIPGRLVSDRIVNIEKKADEMVETRIDLTGVLVGGFGNAVVSIEPTVRRDKYDRTRIFTWIQATQIGLDAFVDNQELVGFATELKTGKPLSGVELSIYPNGKTVSSNETETQNEGFLADVWDWVKSFGPSDDVLNETETTQENGDVSTAETIEEAKTSETTQNGILRLPLPDAGANQQNLLIARKGKDVAFLPENTDYYWQDSGSWFKRPEYDSLRWFVFDDRKMYRPKEEVAVKGYIRVITGGKLGDVQQLGDKANGLTYSVKDPRGNEIGKGTANLNAFGAFDFKFKLPDNANLGYARVDLSTNSSISGESYGHQFQIQEFRRPEFEVKARNETEAPYFVKESAKVSVEAKYYAGGGLANADTNWNVRATPTNYTPPNRGDFTFGTFVPWWRYYSEDYSNTTVQSFKGLTDASGKHILKIDFESVKPARPYSIQAAASVQDVNRQTWASTTNLLVHPSSVYVGLKIPRYFVQKGENINVESIVSDIDGNLLANQNVEIKAILKDWTFEKGTWSEKVVDEQNCSIKSAATAQKCVFPAKQGGRYTITATVMDDKERINETEITVWVAGGKVQPKRNVEQEEAQIIPNKKEYNSGETAELLVMSPFPNAEGVLTLRRDGIVKTERFTIKDSSIVLKIPLEEKYLPNIYAQVDLVGAASRTNDAGELDEKLSKRPAFATGQINLSISTASRQLTVTAEPQEKTLAPGGETKVDVAVTDKNGEPVANSEVAVVVVDESVLALSGYSIANPLSYFYTARGNGVRDFHLRKDILLANPLDVKQNPNVQATPNDLSMVTNTASGAGNNKVMRKESAKPTAMMSRSKDAIAEGNLPVSADEEKSDRDDGNADTPINLRQNFDALAFFAPSVKTDSNGKAVVTVKLPDNLTRYRVTAISVDTGKRFGKAESDITAKQPLMVRPSAPRFMNFGDKVELPVVIQNQTDKDMPVDVAIRATNAILTGEKGKRVIVKANERIEVRFPVSAEKAGTARFQFAVTSGKFADSAEISLPVWTPATTEAFATYGTTDANGAIFQPVQTPGDVYPQFGGLEVTTSSTQLQELTDAFLYLQRYPYECSEQISSRMISIAALRDVLSAFKAKDMPTAEQLQKNFEKDIKILQSRQRDDGSFGLWKKDRERYEYPFLTVHVAHALALAKQKGYKVPDEMLNKTKPFLKNVETKFDEWHRKSPQVRWTISAYALYIRDLMGDKDVVKAKKLLAEATLEKLPFEAIGWILSVLANDKSSTSVSQNDYLIGPGDVITIKVLGEPDFSVEATTVKEVGKIEVPYSEEGMVAANRTVKQLRDDLTKYFGKIVKNPRVSVDVKERKNLPLLKTSGEVKTSSPEVEQIIRFLMNRTTETASTANFVTDYGDNAWLIMYSNRRADGVLLEALIKTDKNNDIIPKLVRGLLDHRVKGAWSNTQENVFILLALDKYFNAFEKVTPDFVTKVWLGNTYAGEQLFKGRSIDSNQLNIPMSYLTEQGGTSNLILDKQGAGRLYYRIGMKYAPKNLKLAPADYGFTVLRKYEAVDNAEDVKQNADGSWTIKSGARVRVRLTMVAQARRYHVALVDNLPAGLEILNPSLAVTEQIPGDTQTTSVVEEYSRSYGGGWWWRQNWFEHQNFRDERAEAFSSLLWEGVYNYSYVARATTPGQFIVPPAKAEEMYHPETFGRTGTDFVKVE